MNKNAKIFVAELIGTFVLVFGGCGSAVLAGEKIGWLGVAFAFGLSLLIMAYTIGSISGCHINPAVTIGLAMAKQIEKSTIPYYIVGQIVGGIVAGGVLYLIAAGNPNFDMTKSVFATNGWGEAIGSPYGLVPVAIIEVILTAFLLFTIMGTTHPKFPDGFGGLSIGLMLVLIHLIGIPVSNTSVNPARSIGVAVWKGGAAIDQLWLFFVAPIIGAMLGVWLYQLIQPAKTVDNLLKPLERVS